MKKKKSRHFDFCRRLPVFLIKCIACGRTVGDDGDLLRLRVDFEYEADQRLEIVTAFDAGKIRILRAFFPVEVRICTEDNRRFLLQDGIVFQQEVSRSFAFRNNQTILFLLQKFQNERLVRWTDLQPRISQDSKLNDIEFDGWFVESVVEICPEAVENIGRPLVRRVVRIDI